MLLHLVQLALSSHDIKPVSRSDTFQSKTHEVLHCPQHVASTVFPPDLRPPWLSKPAFLEFTSLRAYPLRQLHRLCAVLRQRALPLPHPAVQTLVRQLLYHIGPVTPPPPRPNNVTTINGKKQQLPTLEWREGWDLDGDVLPTLCAELQSLAEQLDPAPRDQEAVVLLGEVAAYLSDWYDPCRTVVRRFAAMTSRVADEMQGRVEEATAEGQHDVVGQLQAKQVQWRAMALGCYGAGPLCVSDVGHMVQLVVQVCHGSLFQDDEGRKVAMRRLQVGAHGVMARRAEEVVEAASSCPELLTDAVRKVLGRTPEVLPWQRVQPQRSAGVTGAGAAAPCVVSGSFEAVCPEGNLYSINVLDGTVLLNGRPPSRLPKEVTEHPLFVRTFGQGTNFEVARDARGVLSTLRPVGGRYYEFFLAAATGAARLVSPQGSGVQQRLVVTEVERRQGQGQGDLRLELLDPWEGQQGAGGGVGARGPPCGTWGDQLPVRLRELHSHWISR